MNASVQMKTHTATSAANKNTHILRDSKAYKNPKIIPLQVSQKYKQFSKPKEEKPERAILKNEKLRKDELKKVNSAISVYTKRIEAINPEDEEQKKRILKMQQKLKELYEKREELKEAKSVPEARGRKQEHYFIEFEISLTNSNEFKDDEEFQKVFIKLQSKLLSSKIFDNLELITNVVHLDQHSLHSHAMFALPKNQTWKKHLKQFDEDGRVVYKVISKYWHKLCKTELSQKFNIELENQTSGKRYISLKNYKKQNPVQILEKEEKINPTQDMSDLSSNMRARVERAEQTKEEVNSLFKKEKTSEASERSDTSDSEQTESQSNRRNRR